MWLSSRKHALHVLGPGLIPGKAKIKPSSLLFLFFYYKISLYQKISYERIIFPAKTSFKLYVNDNLTFLAYL